MHLIRCSQQTDLGGGGRNFKRRATLAPETARLLEKYMPNIVKTAIEIMCNKRKIWAVFNLDDAIQIGRIAALEAISKRNTEDPRIIGGYVNIKVAGAILDEIRRLAPVGRKSYRKIADAETAFVKEHGREASEQELAEITGTEMDTVRAKRARRVGPGALEFVQAESSVSDPLEILMRSRERERLRRMIKQLPEDLATVVTLVWFENIKAVEVAKICGVTEGAISQRLKTAYAKLRQAYKNADGFVPTKLPPPKSQETPKEKPEKREKQPATTEPIVEGLQLAGGQKEPEEENEQPEPEGKYPARKESARQRLIAILKDIVYDYRGLNAYEYRMFLISRVPSDLEGKVPSEKTIEKMVAGIRENNPKLKPTLLQSQVLNWFRQNFSPTDIMGKIAERAKTAYANDTRKEALDMNELELAYRDVFAWYRTDDEIKNMFRRKAA